MSTENETCQPRRIGRDSDTVPVEQFPFDEIYDRLDGIVRKAELGEEEVKRLADALTQILCFVAEGRMRKDRAGRIGRKLIAVIWILDPSLIEGSPSLATIARSLKVTPSLMSVYAADTSRRFGIRNRAQIGHGSHYDAGKGEHGV